jgi:predicted glycosyltransferase
MRVLFQLGHPAHFHLFKLTVRNLINSGHKVDILIKKKDILEKLLIDSNLPFHNILPTGRKNSKIGIAVGQLKQDLGLIRFCLKNKPDIMVGTSVAISHAGKLLNIPSINVNEDDAEAVPLYAKLTYPWATTIVAPFVCSTSKWKAKTINYNGYHELAYLHPNHFKPDIDIAKKYVDTKIPFFIIRFSNLTAHHDTGVEGINTEMAARLIEMLKPYGNIIITSEKQIDEKLEQYRKPVDVLDMHHLMAFAKIFIGDSQTMAAESGVLGVPFLRFNDFVGRIGYLSEMEDKYKLGFGIKPKDANKLFDTVNELLQTENLKELYQERRKQMLSEKIDTARFLTWFISNYPDSLSIINENPNFPNRFK